MRLFAAIELDRGITDRLVRLQQRLGDFRGLRWLTPEQMHLTLKFLGDVPDNLVTTVCDTLAEVAAQTPAFEIDVAGAGVFPVGGAVRVVWAGLNDPDRALSACRDRCENAFAPLGFKQEHRAYAPHLTLARVRDAALSVPLRRAVERCTDFKAGRQGVDELVLFESVLKREGAEYAAICRCPLPDPPPA